MNYNFYQKYGVTFFIVSLLILPVRIMAMGTTGMGGDSEDYSTRALRALHNRPDEESLDEDFVSPGHEPIDEESATGTMRGGQISSKSGLSNS